MRFAMLLVVLAGCPVQGGECELDGDCGGGEVCARDHTCTDPANVRMVRAVWTINAAPADAAACAGHDLYIEFRGTSRDDALGFAPVPCPSGMFTVDKLPLRFGSVELGVDGGGDSDFASFDDTGTATLDLRI